MGRKSTKGKEKKMKRKEEQAKIAAAKIIVDAANKIDDPMQNLTAFKKFERNDLSLTVECKKVTELEKDVTDWIFNLVKTNMQSLYESSDWGWKGREKKEELMHEQACFVIARTADGQLVGFCHFRFDVDFGDAVIYCYEIQLTPDVRRKGLGKFLMQILELLAFRTEMKKVMVTVFKNNLVATNFFTKVLKYEIDETSPSMYDPMNDEDYCYEIMSKDIKTKKTAPAANSEGRLASGQEILM
ncbi:N-alpha-acetyltransferase 40 [Strongylocentrotus purpuratus]|uniref:N-alpha-acetyltransferase 40 n=1 Tax=Strongylocentrotus purpuratus TaxID=7668 RepID=A0A7M7HMI9_STRPU|nr:N-alpha-acetyltransferase 40 [Strongylocentrotus purpuratus]